MSIITIAIIISLLFLAYLQKDKLVMLLFNTKKSKYIFIASYIIKISKSILEDDNLSIYISVYLNDIFSNKLIDDKIRSGYKLYFQSYLIDYYESDLVDNFDFNSEMISDIFKLLSDKSNGTVEYTPLGEEKLKLAIKVLSELGNDSYIFSKSLSKISSKLMITINKFK